jgi:hypothetical protein
MHVQQLPSMRACFLVGLLVAATITAVFVGGCPRKSPEPSVDVVTVLYALHQAGWIVTDEQDNLNPCGQAWWLTREPIDRDALNRLVKGSRRMRGPTWKGIAHLKMIEWKQVRMSVNTFDADTVLNYGSFCVLGDPEMLRSVRDVLARKDILPR